MSTQSPAMFVGHPAEIQFKVIMDDENLIRRDPKKMRHGANTMSAAIHQCQGAKQVRGSVMSGIAREFSLEAFFPACGWRHQLFQDPPGEVMPGVSIFNSGVAQENGNTDF